MPNRICVICPAFVSTVEIWVTSTLRELANMGYIEYNFMISDSLTPDALKKIDVLICVRGSTAHELKIIEECKKLNKYVIYFLDDDTLNIPKDIENYCDYFSGMEYIKAIIRKSDCLWVANENLKANFSFLSQNIVVTDPPAILLNYKNEFSIKNNNDKVIIGYAGGVGHKAILENVLEQPIERILNLYGNKVTFEFFGPKPSFIDKFGLTHIPYQSGIGQYLIIIKSRNWDIGLAPLATSNFNSCKSFVKFLDYGALGIPGIYSNVEPYTRIVVNGKNGILPNNTSEEWFNAMCYLIDNPSARYNVQAEAYSLLKDKFNLSYISKMLMDKIPRLIR